MNYKEEILLLVESLRKHGLDRRDIEKELLLSNGYLDQQISKKGNPKLIASMKMLLHVKDLEKAIKEKPAYGLDSRSIEILERIDGKVDNINAVASETFEHVVVTESLGRISLYHSAHMEAKQYGGDYNQIAEDLFSKTAEVYNKSRNARPADQTNKVA